ncbi:hypothetical protein BD779DRAFT_540882 [Infundibulicybe gibba]|nr:hypothetical protein BD779DRAFT_540882 [Infundibulicybe gibba]
MESHPVHTSLPLDAHQEAINSLNWASTNGLLPPNHSAPAPFTPEECQSFTALLRSTEKQGETPFRTNTVSKILLRAICRRQSHSRPDKPLPADAGRGSLHRAGHPTPINSSALVLMAAVYACLAIVVALCFLSQTFMRIAGVGAILIFSSLAVSNIVAVVQSESDSGSIALHVRRATLMLSASPTRRPRNGMNIDRILHSERTTLSQTRSLSPHFLGTYCYGRVWNLDCTELSSQGPPTPFE